MGLSGIYQPAPEGKRNFLGEWKVGCLPERNVYVWHYSG